MRNFNFYDPTFLFGISFIFILVLGCFLQFIVVPASPWHAGSGLLATGDYAYFHSLAVESAGQIRDFGWSAWEPRFEGQAPASVAAALYALTNVEHPVVLLPVNAVLFSLSAVVFYKIFVDLGTSYRNAFFSVFPFFVIPSGAMLWGQIHKDVYSLLGIFLVVNFWVRVVVFSFCDLRNIGERSYFWDFLGLLFGGALVLYVRPYLGEVVFVSSSFIFLAVFVYSFVYLSAWIVYKGASVDQLRRVLVGFLVCGLGLFGQFVLTEVETFFADSQISVDEFEAPLDAGGGSRPEGGRAVVCPTWNTSTLLPSYFDQRLAGLACTRNGFVTSDPDAGSNIDTDVTFSDIGDIVSYLPRALQISLFAPFPEMWFSDASQSLGGAMRSVAAFEMIFLYVMFPGMFFALADRRTRVATLVAISLSVSVALAYALVVANVGTLYRMRYPSMLIWYAFGLMGWMRFLQFSRKT